MYKVLKFQSPFERLKHYNASPEVSLNKAIITQAIIDATNISTSQDAIKYELEAKYWLFGSSEDFIEICDNAQIHPYFVQKITKNALCIHAQKIKQSKMEIT